jgi:hypothetical protein
MKNLKCLVVIVPLLVAASTTTHAQLSLVSANFRPVGIFIPNSSTNQYRLQDCRIDPLADLGIAGTNRFQITATLNRVYTDAKSSGPRLGLALVPGYPGGYLEVVWTEDEITCGYRLQSASNLPATDWQGVSVQANGSSRYISYPSSQISTQQAQFFHLIKP